MTNRTMLLSCTGGLALLMAIVQAADRQPMIVTGLTGTLRVQQGIPCGGSVDQTTPVTGGRLELTPADGFDVAGGGKYFTLTRSDVSFAGFSVSGSCLGIGETRTYTPVRVQLSRTASFTASPTATPGIFAVAIPAADFLIEYVTSVNGTPDTGSKHPREPVTGTIDLNTGAVQMRVVLATRVTFRAGCTDLGCLINETHDGSLTANLAGTIVFPDADDDGVADRSDNCRFTPNADQAPVPTPTLLPPPAVTLGSCLDRNFGAAKATDVCNALPVAVTHDAPLRFDLGANLVTWRGTDSMSRVATATQTVTIVDTTPPTFTSVPANISMSNCGAAVLGMPTATDDCAGSPTFSNDAPAAFSVGATPVIWTATDASGNTRTAVQTVTVVDAVAPTVTCVAVRPTGNAFTVSASDACLGAPLIRLGDWILDIAETIHINETGQPGVRLVNRVGADGFRHFQVGRGEAIVTATDEAGNVGTTVCPVR